MDWSLNTRPPRFGQTWPSYPALPEIIRVVGDKLAGGNVYPSYVQQFKLAGGAGPVPGTLRDRVTCYLWEPNNVHLLPGYYHARLVGSFNTLPLYVYTAFCCEPTGGSFSSASAGSFGPNSIVVDQPTVLPNPTTTGGHTFIVVGTFTSTAGPTGAPYTPYIDWGDGSPPSIGTVSGTTNPYTFTFNGNHTYTNPGTFVVKVTVVGTPSSLQGISPGKNVVVTSASSRSSSSGSAAPPPCITGCGSCAGCAPLTWTFFTDVISDALCTDCELYNGNWTLVYNTAPAYTLEPEQTAGCVWDSGDTGPCGEGVPSWILYTNGTRWWLIQGGGNTNGDGARADTNTLGNVWFLDDVDFDCTSANLFDNVTLAVLSLCSAPFAGFEITLFPG